MNIKILVKGMKPYSRVQRTIIKEIPAESYKYIDCTRPIDEIKIQYFNSLCRFHIQHLIDDDIRIHNWKLLPN